MSDADKLFQHLKALGWQLEIRDQPKRLPDELRRRYPFVPEEFEQFAGLASVATNPGETAWFLTTDDYSGKSTSAFRWNEFELQSLDAAGGDAEWTESIIRFWDGHLPILLSVKSGYAYLAVDQKLQIVVGREPEYEETTIVAPSFVEFTRAFAKGSAGLPSGLL